MCIVFLFHGSGSSRYRRVIASNRDEFLERGASGMSAGSRVLCGRDWVAGGTWLGVTTKGKVAVVTNKRPVVLVPRYYHYLSPLILGGGIASLFLFQGRRPGGMGLLVQALGGIAAAAAAVAVAAASYYVLRGRQLPESRGVLLQNFLRSEVSASQFACKFQERNSAAQRVGPFNMLLLDDDAVVYATKNGSANLPAGIYGLSNASLDTPWGKLLRGKSHFTDVILRIFADPSMPSQKVVEMLLDVLADDEPCEPAREETGLPLSLETLLSRVKIPPCVLMGKLYGTQTSTVVLQEWDGSLLVVERKLHVDSQLGQGWTWTTSAFEAAAGASVWAELNNFI
jgi:uncharacterized protein with NRDE domain